MTSVMTQARWRLRGALLLGAVALLGAGCADDKPLNTFEPRGPMARTIDSLMWPWIWGITFVVFVLVVGGGIYLTIKGRVKPEDYDPEDLPAQTHGNSALEWGWTFAPMLLLAVICYPMLARVWDLEKKNDATELDVMVIGRQWWWEYRYDVDGDGFFQDVNGDGEVNDYDLEWDLEAALDPDDLSVANELVIPAGEQVDLVITSGDVIHSFWIPRLNGKRDAVPGRFHHWSLDADSPGKYTGWCTEFCGLSHARMRMSVMVLTPEDYETWWANQLAEADYPSESDEEIHAGRLTFESLCASCHIIRTPGYTYEDFEPPLISGAAPDLTHFASRSVFAGAIYSQYVTDATGAHIDADDDALDPDAYLQLAEEGRFNHAQVRRWVKDAPSQKAMAADDERGMPSFAEQLTEDDLENIVAYLATLD